MTSERETSPDQGGPADQNSQAPAIEVSVSGTGGVWAGGNTIGVVLVDVVVPVLASGAAGLVAREVVRQIGETTRERLRQDGQTARALIRRGTPEEESTAAEPRSEEPGEG
ncbi:hypothetical protein OG792_32780 [Micromonospora sp. NBC_01699]|uniref:hypothetical protein n=1 Tax=Micromonospora sp. NBC_01699 TaxID=2975984 RepID=UPI002E2DEED2|nr:hypothetical protein [Micromonospora sp. NBC_01699]